MGGLSALSRCAADSMEIYQSMGSGQRVGGVHTGSSFVRLSVSCLAGVPSFN